MPTHTIGSLQLFYQDTGGNGLPVLLLHAFPFDSSMFAPQLEALGTKYRFLAPDARGFGRSSPLPPGTITRMESLAEDALSLLDALDIPQAVIGGVSMGGYTAMALLRMEPSRVRGLVLADTHLREDDAATKERRSATAQALETRGTDVLVETLLPKVLAPTAAPDVRSRVERWVKEASATAAAAASRGMALRGDSRDILARFSGPSLVLVGEQDSLTPPSRAEEMASVLGGQKPVVLPGAGHLSNFESPAAFNAALDEFLERASR